jgi:hypothetical protein
MLKELSGCETYVHFCERIKIGSEAMTVSPREAGKIHGVRIQIHDIHPYIFNIHTNQMTPITCCPFCGADIDNEERP